MGQRELTNNDNIKMLMLVYLFSSSIKLKELLRLDEIGNLNIDDYGWI